LFIRTENFRTFVRLYPVVTFILTINIVLYLIYQIASWLDIRSILILYAGAYGWNLAVMDGQWWRLITPMFLHFSFSHLFFNCISIFLFAPPLELMLRKWKFCIAYFGSGILSNVLSLFFGGPDQLPYVGASAAMFGLFGIFLFIVLLRRHLIDRQSSQIITVILLANLAWTFLFPSVDVLGHLFGLLAGFVLGPILLFRTRPNWYRGY